MSKLIVYGGRRRVSGGRLVTSVDGAPCCCGAAACGPERIKIRISGTVSVAYNAFTSSSDGSAGGVSTNITLVIPGAEITLDRVQRESGALYATDPLCVLHAHGTGTHQQESFNADVGTRTTVNGRWGSIGGVIGIGVSARIVNGFCAIDSLVFDIGGELTYTLVRTTLTGDVLTDFTDVAEEPILVGIPYIAAPLVGPHASQDYRGEFLGVPVGATVTPGIAEILPVQMPSLAAPAVRVTEDDLTGVTTTTRYVSTVSVPVLTVEDWEGQPAVCAADTVVEAYNCQDPDAPRIVVDLRDALEGVPSLPVYQSEVYVPTDEVTGPPVDTSDWQEVTCEPDTETWPVYALCNDPSQTRLVDDTDAPVDAQTAIFGAESWYGTGDRAEGDPDIPDSWSPDPCPVPPMYRLCGDPSSAEGVPPVLRSRTEGDTTPAYFYTATFPSVEQGCQERWVLTYELVPDDGGLYPLLPVGAVPSPACLPPNQLVKACGGDIIPPPDFGPPVGGQNPAGSSGASRGGTTIGSPAGASLTPDEEAGIGSMLAEAIRLVSAGTIKPCSACEKRKRVLNRFGNRVGREILRRLGL